MSYLIVAILAFILGVLSCPLVIFIRARRSSEWDDSNVTNIYRVISHLAVRPEDFGKMYFPNGKKPFWYINKDEFSEVVKSTDTEEN